MVFSCAVRVNRQNHRKTGQNTRQNPVFTRLSVIFPGASRKLRAETGLRFGAFQTMLI